MGYGGFLIYSGLIRNAQKAYPEKKIVVVYPARLIDILKHKKSDAEIIFKNNPRVHKIFSHLTWKIIKPLYTSKKFLVLNLCEEKFNHHVRSTSEKIEYRTGAHAIQFACNPLGIKSAELEPEIYLEAGELSKVSNIIKQHGIIPKKYICIESGSKTEFTPNKAWFEDYWLELVALLNQHLKVIDSDIKIVQIGTLNTPKLEGTIYLNGQLSFRETGAILKDTLFFISYIGGLTHLARAVQTKNLVIKSAWEPKELTYYPGDIDFYTDIKCKHCGLLQPCPVNRECMREIKPKEVFDSCLQLLK